MEQGREPFELAALLAQMGWVQRLAASLVGSPERGADLAQDTMVAALQHRPAVGGVRGLRPWLAAVARKLASRGARRAASRAAIDRDHARVEAGPSAAEAAARVELSRQLSEALLALEEPYRSAVIWRHLDGLSAKEIAKRQHTSVDVARQRVSRGLAMLRDRLDRSFGGRQAWCAAFALRFDLPASIGTAGASSVAGASPGMATIGGLAMSAKSVGMAIGAALLAVVTWIGWRAVDERTPPELRSIATSEEPILVPTSTELAPASTELPTPGQESARERQVLDVSPVVLSGIVLDRSGRPVEGALVRLEEDGKALSTAAARTSDANGRFEWSFDNGTVLPRHLVATAEHAYYLPASLPAELDGPCELVLAARPIVEVHLSTPDDRPLEAPMEVSVAVAAEEPGRVWRGETRSISSGVFVSRGLDVGRLARVSGRAKGYARTWLAVDTALVEEGRVEVDLVLDRGASAHGRVLDARTRQPIAGATVMAEGNEHDPEAGFPFTTTDEQGRFELLGISVADTVRKNQQEVGSIQVVPITARADGYAPEQEMRAPTKIDEVFEVEILLTQSGGSVAGRVRTEDGPDLEVLVLLFDASDNVQWQPCRSNGEFRFDGLPEGQFAVFARDDDLPAEQRVWARHDGEILAGERQELDLVLAPATASLSGRIVDPDGEPVRGARVDVRWFLGGNATLLHQDTLHATTDAEGRYAIEHLYPGLFRFEAVGSDGGRDLVMDSVEPWLRLAGGEHRSDCDLVVSEPVAVQGRVVGRENHAGWDIELRRTSDGHAVARTRTAANGAFELGGLFPAAFDFVVLEDGRELASVAIGPAGASDLVVSLP